MDMVITIEKNEYQLKCICTRDPEMYEVYLSVKDGVIMSEKERVGLIKVQYGKLITTVPDSIGQIIYEIYPKGLDMLMKDEREACRYRSVKAINDFYNY